MHFVKEIRAYNEMQVNIKVLDPGNEPLYDMEGNVCGRTEPLLEMEYSQF